MTNRPLFPNPILLMTCVLVSWSAACADDEKQYTTTAAAATLFDLESKSPVTQLPKGTLLEVKDTIVDNDGKTKWLHVVATMDGKEQQGFVNSKWCETPRVADSSHAASSDAPLNLDPTPVPIPADSRTVTELGFRILQNLPEDTLNPSVSPYSLWANARMWLHAARGETKTKLRSVLGFDEATQDDRQVISGFYSVNRFLKRSDISITKEFLTFSAMEGAEPEDSVFDESARVELNKSISMWTKERIREFYSPGTWNPNASVILVNVACLDAEWETPFENAFTVPLEFRLASGEPVMVDTMNHTSGFRMFEALELDADGIVLPFKDKNLNAVLLLPRKDDGMQSLIRNLDADTVFQYLEIAKQEKVELLLPKFSLDFTFDLFKLLRIADVLPSMVDFGTMTSSEVTIAEMRQTVHLKVDEKGTYAAAATATGFAFSGTTLARKFAVNHPFLLMVFHTPSRTPLFCSRVDDPRPSAKPRDAKQSK